MPLDPAAWPAFVAALNLAPMAAQLAGQTELKSIEGNVVTLALPATHKHLADKAYSDRLKTALDAATGRKWMLAFEVGSKAESSLAAQRHREQAHHGQQQRTQGRHAHQRSDSFGHPPPATTTTGFTPSAVTRATL